MKMNGITFFDDSKQVVVAEYEDSKWKLPAMSASNLTDLPSAGKIFEHVFTINDDDYVEWIGDVMTVTHGLDTTMIMDVCIQHKYEVQEDGQETEYAYERYDGCGCVVVDEDTIKVRMVPGADFYTGEWKIIIVGM